MRLEWKPIEDEKVDGKGENLHDWKQKHRQKMHASKLVVHLRYGEENTYFPTDRMKESKLLQMANQIIRSESDLDGECLS